jgi:diaminopimelate decarboxylase
VDVKALAQIIRDTIDRVRAETNLPFEPKLYMENGRYLTGPYGWLITKCNCIKDIPDAIYYGVDACMANLMRPGMYGSYHHITVPAREGSSDRHAANVVGTLCENNDWFAKVSTCTCDPVLACGYIPYSSMCLQGRDLPRAQVGDLFVIHDTGAHSHSMGFQYNGKLRAPEVLLRADGLLDLIREREDLHCLFDNVRMPADLQPMSPFPYNGRLPASPGAMASAAAKIYAQKYPSPAPPASTPRLSGREIAFVGVAIAATALALWAVAANRRR